MKTFVSILLSAIITLEFTIPGMDLDELAKVPALLYHYHQHRQQDGHISLHDFIKLHYDNAEHHQKDPGTHHDLPFSDHRSHEYQLQHPVFTLPEAVASVAPTGMPLQKNSRHVTPKELRISSAIWQPPRMS